MKNLLLILFFFLSALNSLAQQDPLYAQYFNNPMLINPAFAGSNERLYMSAAYRSQWSGVAGGPTTFNFNSHMSVASNKVGIGILAVQDQLGDLKTTQFGGTASYRIKLSNASMFSFGMEAGFSRFSSDPSAVKILNNPDPYFNQFTQTSFNTGAGLLLQNDRYMISFSVPHMLASSVDLGGQKIKVYSQNYYLYGSYLFYMNENVKFRPSTLMRFTNGSSPAIDVNANFIFKDLYSAGLFTRQFNTYGVLLQLIMRNYRLGYVFELPGKGSALNYVTNEISLSFSLDVLNTHNHSSTGF